MTNRVPIGARVDPSTIDLARKLSAKIYGSEKRIGYLLDDIVSEYHRQKTNQNEAQSYLSNIEHQVIKSLEKRLEAIGERAINAINDQWNQAQKSNRPLLVRQTRESIYASLALEELCVRAIPSFKAEVEPNLNKEITTRMKRKLTHDGDPEGASFTEEIDRLRNEVEERKKGALQLKKEVERLEQEKHRLQRDDVDKKNKAIREAKRREQSILAWTRGLITYLKDNYSRVKSNEKLIEEYTRANPKPEGL